MIAKNSKIEKTHFFNSAINVVKVDQWSDHDNILPLETCY